MSKASDAGKSFLAGVLAKLPESLRAQVETAFTAGEAEGALEVIGTGALAQPEINRKFDELKTQTAELDTQKAALEATQAEIEEFHQKQKDWWAANSPKVTEFDRIKPEYDRLKAGGKVENNGPSNEDLKKEFDERFNRLQLEGAGLMAFMTTLSVKHFREFGTEPDMQSLLADKNLGKPMTDGRIYGIVQAYETKYGEQIKARAEKAEAERIDKLVDERWKERMKGADQPFPLRNQAPSVLDVLESSSDKAENHTVDSATSLYEQLQSARG